MKKIFLALFLILTLIIPYQSFASEWRIESPWSKSGTTISQATTGDNTTLNASVTSIHTFDEANWDEDDATWTMTGTGPLVHATGNVITVTATNTEAIVAGTTYKVTITGTGGTATATYTLGGVTGTTIAASGAIAITDYITASTTASMIITPANTCTVSISAITIEKLTDATGDLTIDGNLIVRSSVTLRSNLNLPQVNEPATPTLAFGDGDSGIYEYSDDIIFFATNGVFRFGISNTQIYYPTGNYFAIMLEAASATNPLYSFNGDDNTGIGAAAADQLSLIAGGVEAIRCTSTGIWVPIVVSPTNTTVLTLDTRGHATSMNGIEMVTGAFSGAGVTQVGVKIMPTINQTTTASMTDLLINRTETAVGSGAQLLIDAQVGGLPQFRIDNAGTTTIFDSYTDASNYEGYSLDAGITTADTLTIKSITAGTGADNLNIAITPAGTGAIVVPAGLVATPAIVADDPDSGFYFGSKGFNWGVDGVSKFSVSNTGVRTAGGVQVLTGAGAVDIVNPVTHLVTTGADALTLADGVEGQYKIIIMKTDGGNGTLTATFAGFTTLTFDDVGDSTELIFTNGAWHWIGGRATAS